MIKKYTVTKIQSNPNLTTYKVVREMNLDSKQVGLLKSKGFKVEKNE